MKSQLFDHSNHEDVQQATEISDASDPLGKLRGLGIESLPELLFYLPRKYRDYSKVAKDLPSLALGDVADEACYRLTVDRVEFYDKYNRRIADLAVTRMPFRVTVRLLDGRKRQVSATVFGNTWDWKSLRSGDVRVIHAKATNTEWGLQLVGATLVAPERVGRIVPIYRPKKGVASQETLLSKMNLALDHAEIAGQLLCGELGMHAQDIVRDLQIEQYRPCLSDVFFDIHEPRNLQEAEEGLRLAKALAVLQITAAAKRVSMRIPNKHSMIHITSSEVDKLIAQLPFPPTEDQRKAINEIVYDLQAPFPMRRLLSGDVGTGKTVTYLVPFIAAAKAGARVVIQTPNELLVAQISNEIREYFPDIKVHAVTGGGRGKLPTDAVLVGTTALLSRIKRDKLPVDVVVVDEQHKFSQKQREDLLEQGTNLLEATATAIPRTLALVTHGGMDVSVLRECPVVKDISTEIVVQTDKAKIANLVKSVLGAGGQIAIMYPLVNYVEDDEDEDDEDQAVGKRPQERLISVEEAYEGWSKLLPNRVGMIHGKMTGDEKVKVIESMKNREFDVLVCSSVIEIGITLPDLKALIVANAECYGVAQLHQLRGRVVRKGGNGHMLLCVKPGISEESLARLQLLVQHRDGFTLAEKNMQNSGFGDIYGDLERQKGLTNTMFKGVKLRPADFADAQKVSTPQRSVRPTV